MFSGIAYKLDRTTNISEHTFVLCAAHCFYVGRKVYVFLIVHFLVRSVLGVHIGFFGAFVSC